MSGITHVSKDVTEVRNGCWLPVPTLSAIDSLWSGGSWLMARGRWLMTGGRSQQAQTRYAHECRFVRLLVPAPSMGEGQGALLAGGRPQQAQTHYANESRFVRPLSLDGRGTEGALLPGGEEHPLWRGITRPESRRVFERA